ncbi:hypothetical protein F383_06922 [Gossypium arboreum]|uniref:Uncharacterized protein n=1 Tax=Gossypium arboreum TaxID=29729 RepID=A0A0B0P2N8_GOSAR|nr:hypothetical protein F383_06922 [Gossypium arboreum]
MTLNNIKYNTRVRNIY